MKVIKENDAIQGKNSLVCKTLEYSFDDPNLDLGIATVTGRFPEEGYCYNEISKELIYVLEGSAKIYFEDEQVELNKGDSVLIMPNDKYYWDSTYCKAAMFCNPAWDIKQHKMKKDC